MSCPLCVDCSRCACPQHSSSRRLSLETHWLSLQTRDCVVDGSSTAAMLASRLVCVGSPRGCQHRLVLMAAVQRGCSEVSRASVVCLLSHSAADADSWACQSPAASLSVQLLSLVCRQRRASTDRRGQLDRPSCLSLPVVSRRSLHSDSRLCPALSLSATVTQAFSLGQGALAVEPETHTALRLDTRSSLAPTCRLQLTLSCSVQPSSQTLSRRLVSSQHALDARRQSSSTIA